MPGECAESHPCLPGFWSLLACRTCSLAPVTKAPQVLAHPPIVPAGEAERLCLLVVDLPPVGENRLVRLDSDDLANE